MNGISWLKLENQPGRQTITNFDTNALGGVFAKPLDEKRDALLDFYPGW